MDGWWDGWMSEWMQRNVAQLLQASLTPHCLCLRSHWTPCNMQQIRQELPGRETYATSLVMRLWYYMLSLSVSAFLSSNSLSLSTICMRSALIHVCWSMLRVQLRTSLSMAAPLSLLPLCLFACRAGEGRGSCSLLYLEKIIDRALSLWVDVMHAC